MKKTLLLFLAVGMIAPAAGMAGGACGDPVRVSALFHEAVYADDRDDAESRLITGIFPVVSCLSREGYLGTPSGIPGRFSMILEILGALHRQSVRMSTPADVDRQIRLWKVNLSAQ